MKKLSPYAQRRLAEIKARKRVVKPVKPPKARRQKFVMPEAPPEAMNDWRAGYIEGVRAAAQFIGQFSDAERGTFNHLEDLILFKFNLIDEMRAAPFRRRTVLSGGDSR